MLSATQLDGGGMQLLVISNPGSEMFYQMANMASLQ